MPLFATPSNLRVSSPMAEREVSCVFIMGQGSIACDTSRRH